MSIVADHSAAVTEQSIITAVENLPPSRWHLKMRAIVGTATFFDGLDGVSIGYVLPVLIGAWKLDGDQIGWIIAIGFVGQAIGSILAGGVAERIGRLRALQIMIFSMGVLSIACALAHDYGQLMGLRLLQGIALGGEVPIAAAYIAEILPSKDRGRRFLMYELLFVVGITAASVLGAWIVPRFGWPWLFILGGLPALLVAPMQFLCIELPRWLASRGRLGEAEAALVRIRAESGAPSPPRTTEAPVPAAAPASSPASRASWRELFDGIYLTRTLSVWVMWSVSYLLSKNLLLWLPSLYRTVYKMPVQQALNLGVITTVLSLAGAVLTALVIDRIGRKPLMTTAFLAAGTALVAAWALGADKLYVVVALGNLAAFLISVTSFALYLYTPEIYPTRVRALGTSIATFWVRVVTMISPVIIARIVPSYGVGIMLLAFGGCAALAALACAMGAVETRGRTLEEISP